MNSSETIFIVKMKSLFYSEFTKSMIYIYILHPNLNKIRGSKNLNPKRNEQRNENVFFSIIYEPSNMY